MTRKNKRKFDWIALWSMLISFAVGFIIIVLLILFLIWFRPIWCESMAHAHCIGFK